MLERRLDGRSGSVMITGDQLNVCERHISFSIGGSK